MNKNIENYVFHKKNFLDETTKKYGEGSLNPKTGVFTPAEENKS